MSINYEWDVELVFTRDDETNDVVEHYFQPSYAECAKQALQPVEAGYSHEIVLVCDDNNGRSWAYMVDGELPEYFEDALGSETRKVPQRFHKEVAAVAA